MNLRKHLFWALLLGWFARLTSAYFVYGPQALDDFLHFLMPAYRLWAGIEPNMPTIRSPLMIWWFAGWMRVGSWVGIDSGIMQLRWIYAMLGTLSLIAVVGTYYWVCTFNSSSERFQKLAIWLVSLHGLMPFISTRALGESIALGFILFGFGLSENGRKVKSSSFLFWGLLSLGFSALVRPQAGLLFVAYGATLLVTDPQNRRWLFNWGLLSGGVLVGIAGGLDLLAHRWPLETLYNYFYVNRNVGQEFGYEPFYSSVLTVMMGLFAPFTLPLYRHALVLYREQKPTVIAFLVFILAHSIVPHKEERFMFPILGMGCVFLAWVWAQDWDKKYVHWFVNPGVIFINTVALVIGCFMNSQSGEIEPTAVAEHRSDKLWHLPVQSLVGQGYMYEYFIRKPAEFTPQNQLPSPSEIRAFLGVHPELEGMAISTSKAEVLIDLPVRMKEVSDLLRCEPIQTAQSPIDRALHVMHPDRNIRRGATWYMLCFRK